MQTIMKKNSWLTLLACLLSACGGTTSPSGQSVADLTPTFFTATVQFLTSSPAVEVKTYAAARFLDHASFGPNPSAIADLKARGVAGWIDAQFALPASQIDASFSEDWNSNDTPGDLGRPYYELFTREFLKLQMSGSDQLRLRTTLALSQFIVFTEGKVQSFGITQYFNVLQTYGLGNFADLLRAVSKSPSMGTFLDNTQNKKEGACADCSLNENYARELMQLFTIGVTQLNQDGSVKRDASGKLLETYTQDDVQAMARALTGWSGKWPTPAPGLRNTGYRYPMEASWKEAHDTGEKKLLGKTIPAGGTAEQDLESVIIILMAHPNLAPFISLRMIQHLVTSNPSPAYIGRMSAVFANNGSGVRGDMQALVRAILLDPEARRADDPTYQDGSVGKIREPILFTSAMLRGFQCTTVIRDPNGNIFNNYMQTAFNAPTVFGFYAPTHRAPGSQLLAPEQKLLTSQEFNNRLGSFLWLADVGTKNMADAGCKFDEFVTAYNKSSRDFLNLVSQRYFRGSMPASLRDTGEMLITQQTWGSPANRAASVLQFLLTSPAFGVIK